MADASSTREAQQVQAADAPVLPDPSLAPPALSSVEAGFTAQDLINRQLQLERDAHEAFPYGVSRCTHSNGSVRQLVFSCRTCASEEGGPKGVCAACSVACHSEHDLVELFHRRNFRCDCGTSKSASSTRKSEPCTLREPPHAVENEENRYDHNFVGEFCYCERGKTYNPHEEKETMFQCLICEDWLHESCTSLARASEKEAQGTKKEGVTETEGEGDASDEIPSLLDHDLFESIICDPCVRTHSNALEPYIGTGGWIFCLPERAASMLSPAIVASVMDAIPEGPSSDGVSGGRSSDVVAPLEWAGQPVRTFHDGVESWKVFGVPAGVLTNDESNVDTALPSAADTPVAADPTDLSVTREAQANHNGKKRALSPSGEEAAGDEAGPSKRARESELGPASSLDASSCRRPLQSLFDGQLPSEEVRLDLFLMPSFRERICRCGQCLPTWSDLPFVLTEEATLSPPPTSTPSESGSTYSLGLAALNHLPRERMISALDHYQNFRSQLFDLLKPFAESGQTVDEETIRAFTAKLMQRPDGASS
ncbi:unnamed protein product [Tilletia controversa]|uniref:UBR-type domain-containing protein n=3 Tax=Tilletia TaxID=13289 RepID=A0A8X7SXZ1_9BASI|nr:hypothetical protein CF336_g2568 [Tilletia laevis]KAE8197725.1 hypothetical protein CF328_g3763 [Tilletia controversa]KAE8263116.1 hypothetical protein A4X03_0g1920 [Tilletia caries]KAE8206662.1 hypothetical protein CF335_g1711 [Tilletia laevis]KAE8249802.1 hypothetical protein A4X06_0g3062 [Tilletia controversa]